MEYINEKLIQEIASSMNITQEQVTTVLDLLGDNNTVPFIARYRKEVTGSLDEDQIRNIQKEFEYGENLQKRKDDVKRLLQEKELLTEELKNQIDNAMKLIEIEDIYRPFKEKKKTKATEAIANGLEPLAKRMLAFPITGSIEELAKAYINDKVLTVDEAITGAKYIIAEIISDNPEYRKWIRDFIFKNGIVVTKVKKDAVDEKNVYQGYYDYQEAIRFIKLYRVLAINRAEKEKIINVTIDIDVDKIENYLASRIIKNQKSFCITLVKEAISDAYKRLIGPSVVREVRAELKEKAEDNAITVFSENLDKLLLQAPMKGKMVLGIDPSFRTGCKLAVLDKTGKVLKIEKMYPHQKFIGEEVPERRILEAKKIVISLIDEYNIEIIAIGNGTASRETEKFIADIIKETKKKVYFIIVSEAGASVYSASELAKEEFPDLVVEERSAASIGRRLQDPLSELVKIDPKSIGVGQYQHDVDENKLSDSLDFVVERAVNKVGVNVNTASKALLQYVSGLNKAIANNIVKYRDENGEFKSRTELKKVPKLGDKAFEQSIGFMRILESKNPLDKTPIHPESYDIAKTILKEIDLDIKEIGTENAINITSKVNIKELSNKLNLSEITVSDILEAIARPTRDPRDEFKQPLLRSDILKLEDLKPGMEIEGTVRNVLDFGAFIDCGIKESGLVHISKMSKTRINHPLEVVSVGDIVKVYVLEVDVARSRLQLSLIKPENY